MESLTEEERRKILDEEFAPKRIYTEHILPFCKCILFFKERDAEGREQIREATAVPDDFEIETDLARGHFGMAFKVLYKPAGLLMALKEVRNERGLPQVEQVVKAIKGVLSQDLPECLAKSYGLIYSDKQIFLCLEYQEQQSLRLLVEKLREKQATMPEAVLRAIALMTTQAVCSLHNLQIAHRDLRPSNILFSRNGQVKLADFSFFPHIMELVRGSQVGSLNYMAPERILDEEATHLNCLADVYSISACAYFAATGEDIYPSHRYGSTYEQLKAALEAKTPQFPETLSPVIIEFLSLGYASRTVTEYVG